MTGPGQEGTEASDRRGQRRMAGPGQEGTQARVTDLGQEGTEAGATGPGHDGTEARVTGPRQERTEAAVRSGTNFGLSSAPPDHIPTPDTFRQLPSGDSCATTKLKLHQTKILLPEDIKSLHKITFTSFSL